MFPLPPTTLPWILSRLLFCLSVSILNPIYGYTCFLATATWDIYIKHNHRLCYPPAQPFPPPDLEEGYEESLLPQRQQPRDPCPLYQIPAPRPWPLYLADLTRTTILTGIALYFSAFVLQILSQFYEIPQDKDGDIVMRIIWWVPGTLLESVLLGYLAESDDWAERLDSSVVGGWVLRGGMRFSVVGGMVGLGGSMVYLGGMVRLAEGLSIGDEGVEDGMGWGMGMS